MKLAVCAVALLLCACSKADVILPTPGPGDAQARANVRTLIAKNGWEAECAEFLAMTPEERGTSAAAMSALGVVQDTDAAIRYINIALEECRKAH